MYLFYKIFQHNITLKTCQRFFTSMPPHMHFKCASFEKIIVTIDAIKWLFFSMIHSIKYIYINKEIMLHIFQSILQWYYGKLETSYIDYIQGISLEQQVTEPYMKSKMELIHNIIIYTHATDKYSQNTILYITNYKQVNENLINVHQIYCITVLFNLSLIILHLNACFTKIS